VGAGGRGGAAGRAEWRRSGRARQRQKGLRRDDGRGDELLSSRRYGLTKKMETRIPQTLYFQVQPPHAPPPRVAWGAATG